MARTRRLLLLAVMTALLAVCAAAPAASAGGKLPSSLPLPGGFQPEGIAIDEHGNFYVGSIPTGAVYRGDVRTGKGEVLVPGAEGRSAIGLKVWHGMLFVAGGATGRAFVYSARSGMLLASYELATGETFVNDVVVTGRSAWFTDSFKQALYQVPLAGGLPAQDEVTTLPLTGDIKFQDGFNTNGIESARGGRVLVIVQSNTGRLFTVDPTSGATGEIDLGGEKVAGDGLLLRGRTLYAVEGSTNQVAKVELRRDLTAGRVVERITDPDFDTPTTIAAFHERLYVVNARFSVTPAPDTGYSVELVDRR